MNRRSTTVLMGALAGAALLMTSATAGAQSKTLQGESETVTATIEAIDQASRTITVKDDKGIYETLDVGPGVARFNELKVGDKITARYYENVVVRVKKPNEAAVDVASGALTRSQTPGGTAAVQRTITVTITAMDPKARSVTVKGPNNYVYSRRVQDKKIFDQLKVGDRLDMTWTNALLLSAEPQKK